jgi:hypothetical protein
LITTAGIDLSEHSVVEVFTKYLLVKAVMDFVALSIATFNSSSVIPSALFFKETDEGTDLSVDGVKATTADSRVASVSKRWKEAMID